MPQPRTVRTASLALVWAWVAVYARYRRAGRAQTAREWEQLRAVDWEAFRRHYDERVPTIEEEFDLWGPYHRHRHEMRYDLVAAEVRRHAGRGGTVLDMGCGSALVADRISDLDVTYIGTDLGRHQVTYGAGRHGRHSFLQATAEHVPLADASVDVVVMSEVIEHLLRPELAVWEVARVLRPGGVLVMTTNNASEAPLRSPAVNPLAWIEKVVGAERPSLISLRPWAWPDAVEPGVWLPHTHHIRAETRRLFAAAGLDTIHASSFEFPPPQSRTARWLEARGATGRRAVDVIEAVAVRTPLVRRLGCHLLMVARRTEDPVPPAPPPGIWPGPFSEA